MFIINSIIIIIIRIITIIIIIIINIISMVYLDSPRKALGARHLLRRPMWVGLCHVYCCPTNILLLLLLLVVVVVVVTWPRGPQHLAAAAGLCAPYSKYV